MKDELIDYSNECDIHVGKLLHIGKLFLRNYGSIVLLENLSMLGLSSVCTLLFLDKTCKNNLTGVAPQIGINYCLTLQETVSHMDFQIKVICMSTRTIINYDQLRLSVSSFNPILFSESLFFPLADQ